MDLVYRKIIIIIIINIIIINTNYDAVVPVLCWGGEKNLGLTKYGTPFFCRIGRRMFYLILGYPTFDLIKVNEWANGQTWKPIYINIIYFARLIWPFPLLELQIFKETKHERKTPKKNPFKSRDQHLAKTCPSEKELSDSFLDSKNMSAYVCRASQ